MTVFLCGFMGCGKSTVGRKLAAKLGCPFTDMDAWIEETAGMTIPEIFAGKGEAYFRDLETQAVRTLAGHTGVIACGGGAMLREENARIAQGAGAVVLLDLPFSICYERIAGSDRPIVQRSSREELLALYNTRLPVYRAHATHRVDASRSPSVTARSILHTLGLNASGEEE